MKIEDIGEEKILAEEGTESMYSSLLEKELESVILKYAISRFPFSGGLEKVPGLREDELPELIRGLISEGIVKVGFYLEEMQQTLSFFYFLRLKKEKHIVLGLDPKEVSVFISNTNRIFRLNDEQYVSLLKIPLC